MTDWFSGGLYDISEDGKAEMLLDLQQGSADHEFMEGENLSSDDDGRHRQRLQDAVGVASRRAGRSGWPIRTVRPAQLGRSRPLT